MASSNKTPHYGLSQFAPTDKPAWQGDYNADMKKIDNGIYAAKNKADSLDASVSEATNKATQALEKAEAAEDAAENAAALAQEAKTTADNISGDLSGKVNKAGDTMTGPLVLPRDPTQPMEAATKQYVDQHGGGASGDFLQLSGGTMTGPITLAADPITAMEAATKQYADKMVPLAGGTMTGALTLPADPTSDMQAATKKYVDTAISGIPTGGSGQLLTGKTSNISFFNSFMRVNALMGNLLFITFACNPNRTIAPNSPLFSINLPAGMTMVEEEIIGWPGWSSSGIAVKFDFVPVNASGGPIVQVNVSQNNKGDLNANVTFFCNYILELKNKEG